MRVLADTSVWVDYLRHGAAGPAAALDGLLAAGGVVMCGPVAAELLAGISDRARDDLWQQLAGLPWADLERLQWRQIGEAAAAVRRSGMTVALTDIEIAVASMAADADLWSRDSDFDRLALALPGVRRFAPQA